MNFSPYVLSVILPRENPRARRWVGLFDPKYRRIPLQRRFGGYMPKRVRGKDIITFIGHGRLERRVLAEKDRHAPAS
ncbi:hypothetical protein HOT99_gp234 [Caulobacter phage CcrBL10]|uniref:Uncharacterized protein n=1 Tax=Caulobacter phage CcrBL10 TaxID=2283269 RepID=A0A385E999_9CAUD|nr:hypothetical protein HOT99_gp234 [Caulobacter phage CcrBL10]AXQ68383.1 hypothetical protein CcrBL10_gp179c [Caulobacter phage CcrBL10]